MVCSKSWLSFTYTNLPIYQFSSYGLTQLFRLLINNDPRAELKRETNTEEILEKVCTVVTNYGMMQTVS